MRPSAALLTVLAPLAALLAPATAQAWTCFIPDHAAPREATQPAGCPIYLYDRAPEGSFGGPLDLDTLRVVTVVDGVEEPVEVVVDDGTATTLTEHYAQCSGPPDCEVEEWSEDLAYLRYEIALPAELPDGAIVRLQVTDATDTGFEHEVILDASATCLTPAGADASAGGNGCSDAPCEIVYPDACGTGEPPDDEGEDPGGDDTDGADSSDDSAGCHVAGGSGGGLALLLVGALLLRRRRR